MSAFADSPRHGPVHFPFGAGLNVLYGLNGAGKSRTLRGIASLLGSDVADLGAGLYGQLFVDPDATLGDTYEPATVAGIVEDVAQLLLSRFTRAVEPWERHEFEDYIEVDQPNDDIGTASTLGGLAAAIAAELRLPKTVISSLGGGGRLLYCPRAGGGADLYLGLQVRDPALGELAEEARALREAVVALPPEEERDVATECNFTWVTDEEHPDWLQRVQRHWSRLIQEKREQMEATFEQANVVDRLRELSAVLGTVPTLDHLALLYVMGHLAAQRDHASAIPAWASVPIIHLGVAYQSKARWREDFRAITTSAHESDEAFVTLEALLRDALVRLAEDEEVALFESHSSTVQLNAALRRHLIEFAQLASTILQEVLGPDAPTLEVRVSPEDAIRTGAPVRVLADDFSIFESVDVRELSDAQRRWAVIALRLAFAEFFLRSGGPVPAPLFVLLE